MKVLFLIVNTSCDMACKDCFYTNGYEQRSTDRIEPENAKGFADRIAHNGFTSVILTGGDPLCSKYKHETYILVEELKKKGLRVLLNTSAAKLNKQDIDSIIQLNIDRVDVSINSYNRAAHDFERGFHYDAVWTIGELMRYGYGAVSTTTVITERNAPYAPTTMAWLISTMGIKDPHYQPVYLHGETQRYDTIRDAMLKCAGVHRKRHTEQYLAQCVAAYGDGQQSRDSICQMGKTLFVCDSLGNLFPCFHQTKISYGNILREHKEVVAKKILGSCFAKNARPQCFGRHCVSLFDNPTFWR